MSIAGCFRFHVLRWVAHTGSSTLVASACRTKPPHPNDPPPKFRGQPLRLRLRFRNRTLNFIDENCVLHASQGPQDARSLMVKNTRWLKQGTVEMRGQPGKTAVWSHPALHAPVENRTFQRIALWWALHRYAVTRDDHSLFLGHTVFKATCLATINTKHAHCYRCCRPGW